MSAQVHEKRRTQTAEALLRIADTQGLQSASKRQIHAAQQAGEVDPARSSEATAAGLLAVVNGLGSTVLSGQRTGEDALGILTYHLDQIFRQP